MSKVTIELELKNADHIAAVHSLTRLLEYSEKYAANFDLDVFDDDEFWGKSLPASLHEIMGAIQFLLTSDQWEDAFVRNLFGYSDEWETAIRFLTCETKTLREMAVQAERPWATGDDPELAIQTPPQEAA